MIGFAIAALKFINLLMDHIDREAMKKAGRDEAVAETLTAIADKLGVKKQIQEKIDAMSDADVDDALSNRGS